MIMAIMILSTIMSAGLSNSGTVASIYSDYYRNHGDDQFFTF